MQVSAEVVQPRTKTSRVTLRIANGLLEQLKNRADEMDIPLNSLITKTLIKNYAFEHNIECMPSIIVPYNLFVKLIDKMDDEYSDQVAKEAPLLVKRYFTILGLPYELNEVIENHFFILGKYCGWFKVLHESNNCEHRLVVEAPSCGKWAQFITSYIKNILESLSVYRQNITVNDNVLVFEFTKK